MKRANRDNTRLLEQKYARKKENENQKYLSNSNYKEANPEKKISIHFEASHHKGEITIKSLKNNKDPLVDTKVVYSYMPNKFVMDEKMIKKVKLNQPENQISCKDTYQKYLIDKE